MGKVRYGQSGYVGSSMSVRATWAYENGEKPLSKINKADLDSVNAAIREHFEFLPEVATVKTLKALLKEEVGEHSWHHTGKYANETSFYRAHDIIAEVLEVATDYKAQPTQEDYSCPEEMVEEMAAIQLTPEQQLTAGRCLAQMIAAVS